MKLKVFGLWSKRRGDSIIEYEYIYICRLRSKQGIYTKGWWLDLHKIELFWCERKQGGATQGGARGIQQGDEGAFNGAIHSHVYIYLTRGLLYQMFDVSHQISLNKHS